MRVRAKIYTVARVNRKPQSLIRYLARVPILYQLVAFVAARRIRVDGASMSPSLEPGDRVLFDRLAYAIEGPRVGDIVLARHPARPGVRMVKRVTEIEGLGSGEFWLLGDNAGVSTDSRTLGAFSRDDIIGRAWVVYWPAGRFRVM